MRLKKALVLSTIMMSLIVGSVVAQEIFKSKPAQMANYYATGQNDAAMDIYKNLTDTEKEEFVKYLEKYPEKFPPLFFIITADYVFQTDKDKAIFFYYLGKLRAVEDVYLCEDKTARGQINMYSMLAPKTLQYYATDDKMYDPQYSIDILQKTLDWDDAHPKRLNPIWACYHGIESFSHKPNLVEESEFPKIRNEVRAEVQTAIEKRKDKNFVNQLKQLERIMKNSQ